MSCPSPLTPTTTAVQKKKSSDDSTGWRSKTTVLSRTSCLVNTPEMSDVKFIFKTQDGTQETIIYGHKIILAIASPVFHRMFFNQNPQLLTPVEDKVELSGYGFTSEAFLAFLKFLYSDEINYEANANDGLSIDLIFGILNCADYYDIPYLKNDCVKQLETIMSRNNVTQILEGAVLFTENDLALTALTIIDANLNFVLESEEILSVKNETLFVIFNRDRLDLDECVGLDFALKWAEHECKQKSLELTGENKRKVLGPVFFEIRFALLTSCRISELVTSNFLTLKESLDIFLGVHNPGHLRKLSISSHGSKFRRWAEDECKRKSLKPTVENKRKVLGPLFFEIKFAALTFERISELVALNFLNLNDSVDICRSVNNPCHLGRTKTTPDGSKFRRSDPEVAFNSKPRLFGQRIELRMELMESIKMEEEWKEENKLEHWNSYGKVQANLFMGGFSPYKESYELKQEIKEYGFHTDVCVFKMNEYRGEFHVRFLYNPFEYEFAALLKPNTYGFSDYDESVEIKEWGSLSNF